jgi:hypothetical protein
MPVIIGKLFTEFEIQDEKRIRAVVRQEIENFMRESRQRPGRLGGGVDPSDPAASGTPEGSER